MHPLVRKPDDKNEAHEDSIPSLFNQRRAVLKLKENNGH
jgi:hypothetical protein